MNGICERDGEGYFNVGDFGVDRISLGTIFGFFVCASFRRPELLRLCRARSGLGLLHNLIPAL